MKAWLTALTENQASVWIASHILLPLRELGQFLRFVIRNYFADGCREQAGSLTAKLEELSAG